MERTISDRYDDTEYFIYHNGEALQESNYESLFKSCLAYTVIYLFILCLGYLMFDGLEFYPAYLLPPVILVLCRRLLVTLRDRLDTSFQRVRGITFAYYLVINLCIVFVDVHIHEKESLTFLPILFLLLPMLYVDSFPVVFAMEMVFFAESLAAVIVMGRGLEQVAKDSVAGIASLALAMFCYWGVLNAFAEHSLKEKSLKEEGSTDLLTGLLNKISFEREAKKFLSSRAPGESAALLILDFDNFKSVNDNYGHLAGDAVLCKFGSILKSNFWAEDIIGRVGGDEFMVMVTGSRSDETIAKHCDDVLHELYITRIDDIGGFSCSIGVGTDHARCEFKELYETADAALYVAKENGKAQYAFRHTQQSG